MSEQLVLSGNTEITGMVDDDLSTSEMLRMGSSRISKAAADATRGQPSKFLTCSLWNFGQCTDNLFPGAHTSI